MKVLVAGDFCDKYRVSGCISKNDYADLFSDIKPSIDSADLRIVNFEFPIVVAGGCPISKTGPNLKGQIEAVAAIKYAGFNVCTLANNHILDQGEKCCLDTKRIIEDAGLKTVGAGKNLEEASKILYQESDGEKIAIINCCEHEFSIATENSAGANPINIPQLYKKINTAKSQADYVIIIVHGGHEQFQLPSIRMQETYRFFIDAGADVVVNHHQHCYSGYEIYNGKPIFYGLGNFLFDSKRRDSSWNEGYMVSISLGKIISFDLHPYVQCNDKPGVFPMDIQREQNFRARITEINGIINNPDLLRAKLLEYYDRGSASELSRFEFCSGHFFKYLKRIGLAPNLLSKNRAMSIINHIQCESHRDKLIYSLAKYLRK